MNLKRAATLKWLVFLFFPLLYILPPVRSQINEISGLLLSADFDGLKQFILSFGVWAPLVSMALMILQALVSPLPSLVIILANAWIFGWLPGAVYSWLGSMAGAALSFALARWYGHPPVEKLVGGGKLKNIDTFLSRHGAYAVLIARLTPAFSFDLVSYAAGLTGISPRTFLWSTAVGQTPAIVLYSFLGHDLSKGLLHILWAVPISLLLVLLGLSLKQWLAKPADHKP